MIDKIKPCPFCGEKFPEVRSTFPDGTYEREGGRVRIMTDYKSMAERIRQTLAEGGNCELTTEEWRAVADLLERQPCEDAISRQAAIDALENTKEVAR